MSWRGTGVELPPVPGQVSQTNTRNFNALFLALISTGLLPPLFPASPKADKRAVGFLRRFRPLADTQSHAGPYISALISDVRMAKPIYVLNGPNLNLLGVREPHVYGHETLADVRKRAERTAANHGLTLEFRQSNDEGQLIDWVQEAREKGAGLIVNAGGLTHTSIALLDALQASELPVVEVHLSNIFRREAFRTHSYVSLAARGVICGFGAKGYELAVEAMASLVSAAREKSKS